MACAHCIRDAETSEREPVNRGRRNRDSQSKGLQELRSRRASFCKTLPNLTRRIWTVRLGDIIWVRRDLCQGQRTASERSLVWTGPERPQNRDWPLSNQKTSFQRNEGAWCFLSTLL